MTITVQTPNLGQTVFRSIVAALVLLALVLILGSLAFGKLGWVRADVWKGRAQDAAEAATQAQGNARSANVGAANASATRQRLDNAVADSRTTTEQSAERVESYASRAVPVADTAPVDADVMRELAEAAGRRGAAADRLQRKGPGRGPAEVPEPRSAAGD